MTDEEGVNNIDNDTVIFHLEFSESVRLLFLATTTTSPRSGMESGCFVVRNTARGR